MAYVRCHTCVGNGVVTYPSHRRIERCPDCGGTGADYKKTRNTKTILESEKTYPSPLPLMASEKLKKNPRRRKTRRNGSNKYRLPSAKSVARRMRLSAVRKLATLARKTRRNCGCKRKR